MKEEKIVDLTNFKIDVVTQYNILLCDAIGSIYEYLVFAIRTNFDKNFNGVKSKSAFLYRKVLSFVNKSMVAE